MSSEAIKQSAHPSEWSMRAAREIIDHLFDTHDMGDDFVPVGPLARIIEQNAASRASQWVKCSERLPEKDGTYWFVDAKGRSSRMHYCKGIGGIGGFTHWHPDTRPAAPERGE